MITLYGAGPGFGLPEISPYVTKTEVQLQLAGLAYRKDRGFPQQSPKGQVPFIGDEGHLVADSTFIRAYLEQKFDFDLDEGLSPVERAQAWAIERMIENHFGWTMAYMRWLMPENFAKGPLRFKPSAQHLCKSHACRRRRDLSLPPSKAYAPSVIAIAMRSPHRNTLYHNEHLMLR